MLHDSSSGGNALGTEPCTAVKAGRGEPEDPRFAPGCLGPCRVTILVARNPAKFVTAMPISVMRLYGDRFSLKVLPIDLPIGPWPVAIVTLKAHPEPDRRALHRMCAGDR